MKKFDAVDILGVEAAAECQAVMQSGGRGDANNIDDGDCIERLEMLLQIMTTDGAEEEWDVLISRNDFELPKVVLSYWVDGVTGLVFL